MERYINELKKLVERAYKKGEVPVAALIVKDNQIISKAYNNKETKKNPLMHAEILAIIKACKKLGDWRLDGCDMYVTLKPCDMCSAIIEESRINNVFYILDNNEVKNRKVNYKKINKDTEKFRKILISFFVQKR